jgi:hypothetical protein
MRGVNPDTMIIAINIRMKFLLLNVPANSVPAAAVIQMSVSNCTNEQRL